MSKKKRQTRRAARRASRGGKTAVGAMLKKVGTAVKKGGEAAMLAPALPFKGVMRKALQKRKINPPRKMSELIRSFYENVIKKGNYEEYLEHVDPVTIGAIVTAVVNFFKKMKKKKDDGEKVSSEENEFADTVEEVSKQAAAMIEAGRDAEIQSEDSKGNSIFPKGKDGESNKMLLIGAALLLFYFAKQG